MKNFIILSLFLLYTSLIYSQDAPPIYLLQDVNTNVWNESRVVKQDEVVLGNVYRIVQFKDIPNRRIKDELLNQGIELLEYLPKYAYLASIPKDVLLQKKGQLDEARVLPILKALKEHKTLTNDEAYLSKRNFSKTIYNVHYFQNIPASFIEDALTKKGFKIDRIYESSHVARVSFSSVDEVSQLLDLPYVKVVSRAEFNDQPEDFLGLSLHRSSGLNNPYRDEVGYDGTGIGVQVRDDGYVGDHIDFADRITNLTGSRDVGGHGDMVAGISVGAGNLNPYMQGMAPNADLFVTNYEANFTDNTLDLHLEEGVLITNSSYSNGCNAGYTFSTEQVDGQIYENPTLLHVFSAGNSRSRNCDYGAGPGWATITGGHKQGKNVIATANLRPNNVLETSSSWGPGHDGRIKPEVAANGTLHFSTQAGNSYREGGGTSAAAPGVAGVCAQLYHAYRDLYNELPKSALIKATLMNTANDLGLPGPDYKFGYGHINAVRAFELLQDQRWQEGEISHDETITLTHEVGSDVRELRVMLYWPDRPASIMAEKALVSNLDLTVVDGGGNTFFPVFPNPHKFEVYKPAKPGIDSVNNVEQVVIKLPASGQYSIILKGTELPFDSEKYYVLYEEIKEPVRLTFPIQDAVFAPEELVRIHWDESLPETDYVTIEYKEENGNWMIIDTMTTQVRMYHWNVPSAENKTYQMRLKTSDGYVTESVDFHSWSLMSSPRLSHRCGTDGYIHWNKQEGASSYEVFALQGRKMEKIATVQDTIAVIENFTENYYAVKAVSDKGFKGIRSIARLLEYPSVSTCNNNNDLALLSLEGVMEGFYWVCDESGSRFSVGVQNVGKNPIDSFRVTITNETNNDNVSEMFYQTLAPDEKARVSFSEPLTYNMNVENSFLVDVILNGDEFTGNNSNSYDIVVLSTDLLIVETPYLQAFSSDITDDGWQAIPQFEGGSWRTTQGIQKDGDEGYMALVPHDFSLFDKQVLRTPMIDIQDDNELYLKFNISYDSEENINHEIMDIYVTSICGENSGKRELLATVNGSELQREGNALGDNPWVPDNENDWGLLSFDFSAYSGEVVFIEMELENRNFNTLVIDNFEINTSAPDEIYPSVKFINEEDCKPGPYIFEDNTYGVYDSVKWFFGIQAEPKSANGPGPHSVVFPENSNAANIRMNVYQDGTIIPVSRAAIFKEVADASFEVQFISNNTVQFSPNQSIGTSGELWYLGDGNRSREDGLFTHTYPNPGTYTVMHRLATDCNTDTVYYQVTISKESAVIQTEENQATLDIYPVPADDQLRLIHEGQEEVHIVIRNMNGLPVFNRRMQNEIMNLNTWSWPSGLYLLTMNDGKKMYSEKIMIVH